MSTGDEWKEGTPYEDPEDRAMRSYHEWLRHLESAMRSMLESVDKVKSAVSQLSRMAIPQMVEEATSRIVEKTGRNREDVEAEVRDLVLVASAEGRPLAKALREHIQSTPRNP